MKLRLSESELLKLIQRVTEQVEMEDENPKLLPVPHYLQSDDSTCGPASLRMVMAFYGLELPENEIATACGHTYELGCRSEDMACAAKALGFDVHLKNNSTIEELSKLVNAGAPVIVDWFCGDPPEGHSSVVIGVSDKNIYILDPFLEEMRVVAKEDFRRCWFDFYETPINPNNLYVGQIMVLRPNSNFDKNYSGTEMNEDELKERCWKGYTQKGMKTMFGKRYPNCVKKKSKGSVKEYFDPMQFIKKNFSKETEGIRDEELKQHEPAIQKLVDMVFKITMRKNKINHLKGFKVLKVTPEGNGWTVLMKPITPSWWNYSEDREYKKKLEDFLNEFRQGTEMRYIRGPQYRNFPDKLNFHLWLG